MRLLILSLVLLLAPSGAQSQQLKAMPMPASVKTEQGELAITQSFSVAVSGFRDSRLERGVQRFVKQLSQQTGMLLSSSLAPNTRPTLSVRAEHGSEEIQKLGEDESY